MKSALMIAYWFPPEGNAAVYRPLRFVRNLPASGWAGRVLAGDTLFDRYDPGLLRLVPEGTEVVRVAGEDLWQSFQRKRSTRLRQAASQGSAPSAPEYRQTTPSRLESGAAVATMRSRVRSVVRQVESGWYHPDMQRPWIGPAVKAALEMCAASRPDVLWATGPPWSAFLVAQRVSRLTGVPYVLDFRTSWTIVPSPFFEAMRPAWAQRRDQRVLRELFRGAQAVTLFYAAEAECFWRMFRGALDPSRIHAIPNGFDGEVEAFAPSPSPKFTILYTGTLSDYGYHGFLEALARFIRVDPARAQRIAVRFVGEEDMSLVRRVKDLQLSDVVSVAPPVPHDEVGRLQREAHALLMLERKPSHKGHELLAGAKLFGYLKAGKPILGVVPHGEAERVLRDVGVSTIADAGSPEAIHGVLELMFDSWRRGDLAALVPDRAACERYSGRRQAVALARALDGLPALDPFIPGVNDVAPSLKAEFAAAGWA